MLGRATEVGGRRRVILNPLLIKVSAKGFRSLPPVFHGDSSMMNIPSRIFSGRLNSAVGLEDDRYRLTRRGIMLRRAAGLLPSRLRETFAGF